MFLDEIKNAFFSLYLIHFLKLRLPNPVGSYFAFPDILKLKPQGILLKLGVFMLPGNPLGVSSSLKIN
jgi:hypothetical protein